MAVSKEIIQNNLAQFTASTGKTASKSAEQSAQESEV